MYIFNKKFFYWFVILLVLFVLFVSPVSADTVYEYKTKTESGLETAPITNISGDYTYRSGVYVDTSTILSLQDSFQHVSFGMWKQGSPDASSLVLKIYNATSQTVLGSLLYTSYSYTASGVPDSTVYDLSCPSFSTGVDLTDPCFNVTFSFPSVVDLSSGTYFFLIEQNGTASGSDYFTTFGRVDSSNVGQGRARCKDNTDCQTNSIRNIYFRVLNDVVGFNAEVRPNYPLAPSVVSTLFNFSGFYDNPAGLYNQLQITVDSSSGFYRLLTLSLPVGVQASYYNLPYTISSGTFVTGTYSYTARLYDTDTGTFSSSSSPLVFTVDYSPPDISTPFDSVTCSGISDIANCFKYGIVWLFYPDLQYLSTLLETSLYDKFPFSWFFQIRDLYDSIVVTSGETDISITIFEGSSFEGDLALFGDSLNDVPAISNLTTVIKGIISAVLYFLLLAYVSRVIREEL